MSSYPLVKFVDSPSTSATVRYDCNDQAATPAKKVTDFDPGVPTLEGDPDAVGQSFGFRSPQIVHTIKGTKAQAMAALSAVSKEMLRRTNWVLFQLNATTSPVWFKTYRTSYEPLTLDQVYVRVDSGGSVPLPDTWKITIPLVADAFAYGARQTISALVIQGPTDLTTPTRTAMHVVLPALKGDAPTKLRVSIAPTGNVSGNSPGTSAWLIGCSIGESSMTDPVMDIGTGDGFIPGTGMAAPTADATYFSGSYRVVTIGAAGPPNLISRGTATLPVVPLGRYKILLRAAFTAGAVKTLQFRLNLINPSGGAVLVAGSTVSVPTLATDTGRKFWVELGDFQLPTGVIAPTDGGGTVAAASIGLDIGTQDGSASSVNVDALKLIPVDGPLVSQTALLRLTGPAGAPLQASTTATFDGDLEQSWARTTSTGNYLSGWLPTLRGGYPVADPAAAKNILHIIALDPGQGTTTGATRITDLNDQDSVDVSYYPRYLHVGDGT